MTQTKLRIVVLISGAGSNLQAIIDACNTGLAVEVLAVISDQADAYGLVRAQLANIPTHVLASKPNAEELGIVLGEQLDAYQPDLVVLAGFMRRLSAALVTRYAGRMINIHPSLLPKYPGLHTHQRVLAAGDCQHGSSIHFVTAEIDAGPIICQGKLTVSATDDEVSLRQRVQEIEHIMYRQVLAWFAAGRINLTSDNEILVDGCKLSAPIILEQAVNSDIYVKSS